MMERKVSTMRATNGTLMPIVRVLVDAAIIYSGMLLAMLICFLLDNNVQFIMQDMVFIIVDSCCEILLNLDKIIPIIPIAFYMVFVRITFRNTTHNYASTVYPSAGSDERERNLQLPMQPMQIHIPQWTHRDGISYGVGNQDQTLICKAEFKGFEGASV
jgi:hypothetical protein